MAAAATEKNQQTPPAVATATTVDPKFECAEKVRRRGEEERANEAANGANKAKAAVATESLAERVRRRCEEEHRAKAAAAVTPKEDKAEQEKKAMAAWGGWKERVQGELKVLTDMKWADGVVEAARKNKEVLAVGVAAFSLGFLVSHKLFRK